MKTIETKHLTRVKGNGTIAVTCDDAGVTDVKFNIYEGPRLFERLVVGKTPAEVPGIVSRICAACSVSHRLAAVRAMESALCITPPRKVELLRELLLLGERIDSHGLHVYTMALPDYLGFPSIAAMMDKFKFEAQIGIEVKKLGKDIIRTVGGRSIHGENPAIGGFGRYPEKEELVRIKQRAGHFIPFAVKTASLFGELVLPDLAASDTVFACIEPGGEGYGFTGETIAVSTKERLSVRDYGQLANEQVKPHSFCKRSRFKGRPYSVGALARVTMFGDRLELRAGEMVERYYNEDWSRNPLYNNAARALEILQAVEMIPPLVDEINGLSDPRAVSYAGGEGAAVSAVESPGGALFHAYELSGGLVRSADIVSPTAQNAEDIERHCLVAARKLFQRAEEDRIDDIMNMVVRAYDPCISCSVH
ncbi:MAG: Ni/Fe hydrogenase subunit alpha [Pseudomonadota bacterium]